MSDNLAYNTKAAKLPVSAFLKLLETMKKFIIKLLAALSKKVKEKIKKSKAGKTSALNKYCSFGNILVSKKLIAVLVLIIFVILLAILLIFHLLFFSANVKTGNEFLYTDAKLAGFTGKAIIKSGNNSIIYNGNVINGKCTGFGTLYDTCGKLLYKGDFKDNLFDGTGKLYNPDSDDKSLRYEGAFISNRYSKGVLYDDLGNKIYKGGFENNLYNGEGTEYFANGTPKYEGQFKEGKYEGSGKLIDPYCNTIYDGNLLYRKFDNNGQPIDSNSTTLYDGDFHNGLYEGTGKLYDHTQNNLIYSGEFSNNTLIGTGTLYNKSSKKIFTGTFTSGNIDYLIFLGMPAAELKNYFLSESKTEVYSDFIYETYAEMGITLKLKSSEALFDQTEAQSTVDKIVFWNNPNTSITYYHDFDIFNGVSSDYSGYALLEYDDQIAIENKLDLNLLDYYPDKVYIEYYPFEEYSLTTVLDKEDGTVLYNILSKEE